jgi:hypothetical protein
MVQGPPSFDQPTSAFVSQIMEVQVDRIERRACFRL